MARTIETTTTEEMQDTGGFLDVPGKYHFLVKVIKDGVMPNSDDLMNHPGLGLVLEVLHGPETGKTCGLMLGDPDLSHKDRGAFAKKKQQAFLIAANVIAIKHLNGSEISYDEQAAKGAQIIAEVEQQKDQNGDLKKFLDWRYANIWHVDDPRAASVEKDHEALKSIDPKLRRKPEYFTPVLGANASKPPVATAADFDTSSL